MPSTYNIIAGSVLGSNTSTVTFSSIPNTYTDLVIRMSVRLTSAATIGTLSLNLNNDTSSIYSVTRLYVDSGGNNIYSTRQSGRTNFDVQFADDAGNLSNTFGCIEVYIPTYLASRSKAVGSYGVSTDSTSGNGGIGMMSDLYESNTAISRIDLGNFSTTQFVTGSSFYLYGIKNS